MKLSKILFTSLFVLCIFGTGMAQQMEVGFRAGYSLFTVKSDLFELDNNHTSGLNLAIPLSFPINERFAIQPELQFIQKGVAFSFQEAGITTKTALKTNYLELPILFKTNFPVGKMDISVLAGPSVGYALNRFVSQKIGDGDRETEDVDFVDSGAAKDQRRDLGLVGGISASWSLGIGSVVLDARYSLDLNDDAKFEGDKPADYKRSTNRGFLFSAGYVIPIGK